MSAVDGGCVDKFGPYTRVWQCEPPAVGARFRVLSGEWSWDWTTYTVWAWEAA